MGVGVGDNVSTSTDICLNQMGGASITRPAPPYYYPVTTDAAIHKFLFDTVSQTLCYVQLDDPNFDKDRLNLDVFIDNAPVFQDPTKTNGWDFADLRNGHLGILFFGPACYSFLRETSGNQIQKIDVNVCPR